MDGQQLAPRVHVGLSCDSADRLASSFDVHYERLYRLARRLAPSADDALDLVQETFLRAARFPNSIPSHFSEEEAWLVRVLINIHRDQWRRKSVRERYSPGLLPASHLATFETDLIVR